MNVLLIPSSFPTQREPWPGNYIHEYARSLALQHEVTVVYPQQLGKAGVGDKPFFSESWLEPRIRLVNFSYSHIPKTWALSYLAAFRKVWGRMRDEWKIDVIYAHVVKPAGLAAVRLGRLSRLPVILTEHWGPARDWLTDPTLPPSVMKKIISRTYRRADYLTAVSKSLADEMNEMFGVTTHGNLDYPIDCELFHPAKSEVSDLKQRVMCLTRGQVDPRKGHSNLIDAWKIVAARTNGDMQLDLVGPDIEQLQPQLEAAGIASSCRLLPWRPAAELAPLIQSAALMVIPSNYETFGRSGAEALACGVPVVATSCGGPSEYVEEGTGLMVPVNDASALAESLLAGLQRSRFLPAEILAQRIRERFSYEVICGRFTEVAEDLIENRRAKQSSLASGEQVPL